MGWASGASLFLDVWQALRPKLRFGDVDLAASALIELFENRDCDTIRDVIDDDPELLAAYRRLHPED